MPFWIDICQIFDPNLPPKIQQNRSKIDAKMPSHCFQLGPPEPKKSSPRCRESTIFQKIIPFWLPKSFQILPKIDPKMHQFFNRFWHRFVYRFLTDFGSQLGAMLATFSSKMVQCCGTPPPFLLGLFYFSIFWLLWSFLGPVMTRFEEV